jgi:CheY-like chemotaxis protein
VTTARKGYLLVGDPEDPFLRATLEKILKELGEVHVTTGKNAIDLVKSSDFLAVMVDASVVGDFGMLVSRIRLAKPHISVIVLTASPTWELAREAFMSGATDYVVKSLDQEYLACYPGRDDRPSRSVDEKDYSARRQ